MHIYLSTLTLKSKATQRGVLLSTSLFKDFERLPIMGVATWLSSPVTTRCVVTWIVVVADYVGIVLNFD